MQRHFVGARGSSRNDGSMQRQCEDTCTPRAATQHGHACCACQVSTCPTENAAKHRRQQHPDSPELHASLTAQPREGPALPCRRCPAACLMSAAEALHRPGSTTWTSRHKHSLTKHSRGQFDPARPVLVAGETEPSVPSRALSCHQQPLNGPQLPTLITSHQRQNSRGQCSPARPCCWCPAGCCPP